MNSEEFDLDHFAHQLKYYRKKRGWTQAGLAAKLDTDERNIRRWENLEVQPRATTVQKLSPTLNESEHDMKRRDFLCNGFQLVPAYLLLQESHRLIRDIVLSSHPVLFHEEESKAIEAMIDICWQMLPHFSDNVFVNNLKFVQCFGDNMLAGLREAPGDERFSKALIQAKLVEGRLLYANKDLPGAEKVYLAAKDLACEKSYYLLASAAYAWYANFLIDIGQSSEALDPIREGGKLADQGHAHPLLRSWIFATEADARSNLCYDSHMNQSEASKSRNALNRALEEMEKPAHTQLAFRIPYDEAWVYGYEGTVFAHIGEAQNAQNALNYGISSLNSQKKTFRQWGLYKDLVISQSQENKLEEACASARTMLIIAEQSNTTMEFHRSIKTINDFLGCWNDHTLIKDLREEFHLSDENFNL